jgi:hypothetical protein
MKDLRDAHPQLFKPPILHSIGLTPCKNDGMILVQREKTFAPAR